MAMVVAFAWLAPIAMAEDGSFDHYTDFQAVPEEDLAQQRGGFVMPNGMELSIGIERAAFVNGELQSGWSLNAAGVEALLRGASPQDAGVGSTRLSSLLPLLQEIAGPQLLQNGLDHQLIQNITRLDIRAAGLDIRPVELGQSLDFQLVHSLR